MDMYYLLLEGKPHMSNNESREVSGAYINCWVKADGETAAIEEVRDYQASHEWDLLEIEEILAVNRERYLDEPNSLECFDQASDSGIGAVFYTWPVSGKDDR